MKVINARTAPPVCFGPFRLSGPAGPLFRDGVAIPLRKKSLNVLWLLVGRPGEAMSKESLIEAAWPDCIVSESSLSVCIREIREALGDDPRAPRYVQTMHRHGYRFVGRLERTGPAVRHAGFVGRHAELESLSREFAVARRGESHLVLVSGHAGVGKSALIQTWTTSLDMSDEVQIALGHCADQSGASEAYLPFLDALNHIASGPDAEQVVATMRRVAPSWLLQFPALVTDDQRDALARETRDANAERMRRELVDLLAALSTDMPLVLVIEDMHWCDASSAAALAVLARARNRARLLVIASFRSADVLDPNHVLSKIRGELGVQGLCSELELDPLAEADVSAYLAERFEDQSRRPTAKAFFDRTEGHPLFMTALADHLAATDKEPAAETVLDETVPADLSRFIELRLADLKEAERRVVEAASVAGVSFSAAEIEDAVGPIEGQSEIEHICETLCRRGEFLEEEAPATWPDGTLTGRYAFRHALYPEVTRSTIGDARLARLHRAIGERLERSHEHEKRAIANVLAHHFEQAHGLPRAVTYLIEAAASACSRYAHVEAIQLLRHGLSLIDEIEDSEKRAPLELDLLLALGPVQVALKGYGSDEVERTFASARQLCAAEPLAERRFPVLRGLAAFHHLRADYSTAHELGRELLALGPTQANVNDGHLLEGHFVCGMVDFLRGRHASADAALERAIGVYDRGLHADHAELHGIDPGVMALGFAALVRWMLGDSSGALAHASSALSLAAEVDHPFTLCQGHAMAALLHQFRGDVERTRIESSKTSDLAMKYGFPYLIACEQARRGWMQVQEGDTTAGTADLLDGISLYKDTGAVGGLTIWLAYLVEAYLISGDFERGLETVDEALALIREHGEGVFKAELLRLHGELLRGFGGCDNLAHAEKCLNAALTVARRQRAQPLEVRTTVSLARLCLDHDRIQEARDLLIPIRHQADE